MMRFRLGKVQVELHFSFLLLLSLFLLLEQMGAGLGFLLAVLIHELGHLLMMGLLSLPVEALSFSAFGIAIQRGESRRRLLPEMLLYLAGPGMNLLCVGLLDESLSRAFHLILALLNLLPILPMDGGNIQLLLLESCLPPERAERWAKFISRLWTLALLIPALCFLRQQRPTLLLFVLILALQQKEKGL
ncbi:MAG: hypothetical protein J6A26_06740 [Oscillospiraceae bacterium]|nr:hypothetical protein [Oscillospiraceae bacterium]